MCSVSLRAAGLRIAAMGSTFTARPATRSKPAGVFIHALAMTTKIPDAVPLRATVTPASQCVHGDTRSQPYR